MIKYISCLKEKDYDRDVLLSLKKQAIMNCTSDYSQEELEKRVAYIEDDIEHFQNRNILVYEKENKVLGFGSYAVDTKTDIGKIEDLYVLPSRQGENIGKLLLESLEKELVQITNNIQVRSTITARTFYEKYGYKCVSKTLSKAGFSILVLEKDLPIFSRQVQLSSIL